MYELQSISIDSVQTIRGRGTLLYLAPELRDFSHPHSTASDIYSFGLMLWELNHGKLRENEIFIDQRVLKKTEDKLATLVRKCLNKNAQQRPSIRDIVIRLDNIFPLIFGYNLRFVIHQFLDSMMVVQENEKNI